MKNRILLTLILSLFAFVVSAQTAENVVRNYVMILNDWLASPYDYAKKEKVISVLSDPNGNCTMSDEIVEKFNSDAGKFRSSRDTYLSILSEKNREKTIRVEIIDFKHFEYQSDKTVVTVSLKYSGGISLTTFSEFWIFDDKIGYIDKGRNAVLEMFAGNMRNTKEYDKGRNAVLEIVKRENEEEFPDIVKFANLSVVPQGTGINIMLNEIIQRLEADPELKVRVVGHASYDENGVDAAANHRLANERAEELKSELVKRGCDASRILMSKSVDGQRIVNFIFIN